MSAPDVIAPPASARRRRPLLVFLPLVGFGLLAALFFVRLHAGDPSLVPSPLIGKPAPNFSLPPIAGMGAQTGLSDADLRQGHVTIVNVFASWCVPCREEHPNLMRIAQDETLKAKGVRLVGLAYKDEPANSRKFLADNGDPYALIGADVSGRTGIDFGVYGVPETFVVRGDGTIVYKFIGPLSAEKLTTDLLPHVEKAIN